MKLLYLNEFCINDECLNFDWNGLFKFLKIWQIKCQATLVQVIPFTFKKTLEIKRYFLSCYEIMVHVLGMF
jgi:hypothetical protein